MKESVASAGSRKPKEDLKSMRTLVMLRPSVKSQ